jgi:hypothetical protein
MSELPETAGERIVRSVGSITEFDPGDVNTLETVIGAQ